MQAQPDPQRHTPSLGFGPPSVVSPEYVRIGPTHAAQANYTCFQGNGCITLVALHEIATQPEALGMSCKQPMAGRERTDQGREYGHSHVGEINIDRQFRSSDLTGSH